MNRRVAVSIVSFAAFTSLAALAASATAGPPRAYQRPLADFLSTQGSTVGATAPVPDHLAFTDVRHGSMISIDSAAVAHNWDIANSGGGFGTIISGTITERPLADGRAEVQIIVHATSALAYVVAFDPNTGPDYSDVLFGELADGSGDLAFGECQFRFKFINTEPNAPIPDLFDAFINGNVDPRVELLALSFFGQADGILHEGAVAGVPEGTSGSAHVLQSGLFMIGFHGAVSDGFPAERVWFQVD